MTLSSEFKIEQRRVPERYYPWVVRGIAFFTVAAAFGARIAFAVFLILVIEEFQWNRALASGVLMVGSVIWTLAAPAIGLLLDRFGPRAVLAAGSIIMGLGFLISGIARTALEFYPGMGLLVGLGFASLTMISQATFMSKWFVRKRGMAMDITASGIGVGSLVVVPLTQFLIDDSDGVRPMFMWTAGPRKHRRRFGV